MKKEELMKAFSEFVDKNFGGSSQESEGDYEGIAKAADIEKNVFTSVVLRPNVPDLQGDVYDANTVEDACYGYGEFCRKANLQHLVQTELAVPVESYIAQTDFALGEGQVLKGDWVMSMKVNDPELWQMCKDGTFTGFSIGCMASTEEIDE